MKDLYWKVLDRLDNYEFYTDPNKRSELIERAKTKVEAMTPLELLETISDVFEAEANK